MTRGHKAEDGFEKLRAIAANLKKAGRTKSALMKNLKKAGDLLESLDQSAGAQKVAKEIVAVLEGQDLLNHKDEEVQIRCAHCFCHLLRIYAPETPPLNSNGVLLQMFKWFLVGFRRLKNPRDPNFAVCQSILDIASQTKCCVLVLDLEHAEAQKLFHDLIESVLSAISEDTVMNIGQSAIKFLVELLSQGEEESQDLMDLLLSGLVPPKSDENPALARLTAELVGMFKDDLRLSLQSFLVDLVEGEADSGNLRRERHLLLYQVHRSAPQTLLPVFSKLMANLTLEVHDKNRLAAIELMGKLLALPNSGIEAEHPKLLTIFLTRSADQSAELRQAFLKYCPGIVVASSQGCRTRVMEEMQKLLVDFDEGVRKAAVAAFCSTAIQKSELVDLEALEDISTRLRDTKPIVRKEAAQQLMAVYRAYCTEIMGGRLVKAERARANWIPGRLCLAAVKDPMLGQFVMDIVFKNGLLPVTMEAPSAAGFWEEIYCVSKQEERDALMRLLKAQAIVKQNVRVLISHRSGVEENEVVDTEASIRTPPPPNSSGARLKLALANIAKRYSDPAKAQDCLQKLSAQKDNHIFRTLGAMLDPRVDVKTAQQLTKELLSRVGSRGAMGEFCKSLCTRLLPGILPWQHLEFLVESLALEAPEGSSQRWSAQLVIDAAANNPYLFSGMAAQVRELFAKRNLGIAKSAAHVLAHAGREMAKQDRESLLEMVPVLEELCCEGNHTAAKAAIRALGNILEEYQARQKMTLLSSNMADVLDETDTHLLAKLETVSEIGRLFPEIFAEHAATVVKFLIKNLLPAAPESINGGAVAESLPKWATFSSAHGVKAVAIKVISRAFVPHNNSVRLPEESLAALAHLLVHLDAELDLLPEDDDADDAETSNSTGLRRLAAASGLLKICRFHEGRISVPTYFKLALTRQDILTAVRSEFSAKVIRLVGYFCIHTTWKAAKYAAMLALGGMDPVADCRQASSAALHAYAATRRAALERSTVTTATSSGTGPLLHETPEFLLPYLVQILAHHPDLPSIDDMQMDVGRMQEGLQPFVKMLQFALQALLLTNGSTKDSGASFAKVILLLEKIKTKEDAGPEPATQSVRLISELGLAVTRCLFKEHCGGDSLQTPPLSQGCPLPVSLFRNEPPRTPREMSAGTLLPEGFEIKLDVEILAGPRGGALQESSIQNVKPGISKSDMSKLRKPSTPAEKRGRENNKTPVSREKRELEISDAGKSQRNMSTKMNHTQTAGAAQRRRATRDHHAKHASLPGKAAESSRPSEDSDDADPDYISPLRNSTPDNGRPEGSMAKRTRRFAANDGEMPPSLPTAAEQAMQQSLGAENQTFRSCAAENTLNGGLQIGPVLEYGGLDAVALNAESHRQPPKASEEATETCAGVRVDEAGRGRQAAEQHLFPPKQRQLSTAHVRPPQKAGNQGVAAAVDLRAASEEESEGMAVQGEATAAMNTGCPGDTMMLDLRACSSEERSPALTRPGEATFQSPGLPPASGLNAGLGGSQDPAADSPRPKRRAKRNRELHDLLQFADSKGIDHDPLSPRSRRSSGSPNARPAPTGNEAKKKRGKRATEERSGMPKAAAAPKKGRQKRK